MTANPLLSTALEGAPMSTSGDHTSSHTSCQHILITHSHYTSSHYASSHYAPTRHISSHHPFLTSFYSSQLLSPFPSSTFPIVHPSLSTTGHAASEATPRYWRIQLPSISVAIVDSKNSRELMQISLDGLDYRGCYIPKQASNLSIYHHQLSSIIVLFPCPCILPGLTNDSMSVPWILLTFTDHRPIHGGNIVSNRQPTP